MIADGHVDTIKPLDIYQAHCAREQANADTLYKLPPIFATIIGGLWYFATQQMADHKVLAIGVFLFSAAVAAGGFVTFYRVRLIINGYLDSLERFEGPFFVSVRGQKWMPSVVRCFMAIMLFAIVLAFGGVVYVCCL